MTPAHVILGAGYLAPFLWRAVPAGEGVLAVRRQWPAVPDVDGVESLACDLTTDAGRALLRARLDGFAGTVYFTLPPSALGDAPDAVLAALAGDLARSGTQRVVVASSTGIWADAAVAVVDEKTPALLASPRTRRLAAIESAWAAAGLSSVAVRLAGLWGPGRIVGQDSVRAGQAQPGDPNAWLNLVRAEDAAAALVAAARLSAPPPVLLISDGRPLRRAAYYTALASALGVAAPSFDGSTPARGGGARRCDPRTSWRRLGLAPRHDDVAAELAGLIAGTEDAR
ncbi:MAG: hypothetical protein AB7Q81_14725 [Gammaproteobacteria bacterium]